MGKLLPVLLLLLAVVASAQRPSTSDAPVVLRQLDTNGIWLDNGWKFQPGDNPAYADPKYDDSKWQPIDPTKDIHDLPQVKKGIAWFRFHFIVDTSTLQPPLALMMQQSGASEIFLNGKLIHQFGVLSTNANVVKAVDPLWRPILLPVNKNTQQVLAIRYTLQPDLLYTTMFETANPALWIKLVPLDAAVDNYQHQVGLMRSWGVAYMAIFIMLVILHAAFYLYHPSQKANLYFALYAFLFFIDSLVQNLGFFFETEVAYKYYLANLSFALLLVSNLFLLTAIYRLLRNSKKDGIFWLLVGYVIVSLFLHAFVYDWGWKVGGAIVFVLIQVNIKRIAFMAVREKKQGAWIIAAGATSYLVFFIAFMSQGSFTNHAYFLNLTYFRAVTNLIAVVSIPAATSIYLGLDFALINRSLQQKLMEVEQLSQKTIIQEQEKQQTLTTQKELLEQQVLERTAALNQSLQELKATQAQLVQREKMASLGEVVGGIAHEIQNPLNFVNNFSETNLELLNELDQELDVGANQEAKLIAKDVIENEQKIYHHGRRADAIVRGMLQHSRGNTGKKEPINLNALVEEYLRLSYHAIRAKEKELSVVMDTRFDVAAGMVNAVPQDLGRVLLNLFADAFHALVEKKKQSGKSYQPLISVSTRRMASAVEIKVTDNGIGIPKNVQDKIFQPFFTTKPAGEGTGLGLSLSYDIITKGHGGELMVNSVEDEGATFVVRLPK